MVSIEQLKNNAAAAEKEAAQKLQLYRDALNKEAKNELEKIAERLSDMISNDIAIADIKAVVKKFSEELGLGKVGGRGRPRKQNASGSGAKKTIVSVNKNNDKILSYIKSVKEFSAADIISSLGGNSNNDMLNGVEWKDFRAKHNIQSVGPSKGPSVKYKGLK